MNRFGNQPLMNTEHQSLTDKMFGILCVDDNEFAEAMLSEVVGGLIAAGCIEQNIKIKHIPLEDNIPMGILFYAEYSYVDAVIVLSQVVPFDYVKEAVINLETQWNMPVVFGSTESADTNEPYQTAAERAIAMVELHSSMESEFDRTANPDSRSVN